MITRRFIASSASTRALVFGLLLASAGAQLGALETKGAELAKWPSAAIPTKAPFQLERIQDGPALARGEAGAWDSAGVLNPSVVYFKDHYIQYYSGFDGKVWRLGIATSKAGVTWEKAQNNPVFERGTNDWDQGNLAPNGAAVVFGDKVFFCYQGVDREGRVQIGLAVSSDGLHFTKHPSAVLTPGAQSTWDSSGVADPYLLVREGQLYLYYRGTDEQNAQRLGVARSADGITWERFPGNPILDRGAVGNFDENGLAEPCVAFQAPNYYLFYTGSDVQELRNLGYAISSDGTHWKKMTGSAGFIAEHLRFDWFSKVISDATVQAASDGKWTLWFGGGSNQESLESWQGQVGHLSLDLSPVYEDCGFDAETDWTKTEHKSNEVLRGSNEIEGDMGSRSTWVGSHASLTLKLNPSVENKDLVFEGWAPAELIGAKTKKGGEQTISLFVNGIMLSTQTFAKDDTFTMRVPWKTLAPLITEKKVLEVEVKSDRFFVPSQVEDSKDSRELAFTVKRILFRSK